MFHLFLVFNEHVCTLVIFNPTEDGVCVYTKHFALIFKTEVYIYIYIYIHITKFTNKFCILPKTCICVFHNIQ